MTSTAGSEYERNFDVDELTPLPLLHELPAVARVEQPVEHELKAVYFDTVDLVLAARRIALRRQADGDNAGWHLTLPASSKERHALAEPLGTDPNHIPDALLHQVRACVRDQALIPVARLRTHRVVHRLLAANDHALAVFRDDRVHAELLVPEPADLSWREWEIELVNTGPAFLDAAQSLLAAAGAQPTGHSSTLARALGGHLPKKTSSMPPKVDRKSPAGNVLLKYLHEQVQVLTVQDPLVRRDEPDAVHQMRVACRRLRSALTTYRSLVDAADADHLRAELQWLAKGLGAARDIQVIHRRLERQISEEPPEHVLGPVTQRIDEQLEADFDAARLAGLETLDSARYFRLLDALDALLATTPLTDRALRPAHRVIPGLIRKEVKRLRKTVRVARTTARGTGARDLALHDVRKNVKRLRYAAETALPLYPKAAHRLVNATQVLQTILGDHQDSVVARGLLLRLSAAAYLHGENSVTYGRLHALEQVGATASDEMFLLAWNTFPKPVFKT